MINYCLLSDTAEKRFSQSKYDFLREEEHSISLEFDVLDKKYIVERKFEDNQLVSFGSSHGNLEEYSRIDLLEIFSNLFFPTTNNQTYIEGNRYRTLMQFFIKDDLQNQERIDPTDFFSFNINTIEKATYNFFLMNLITKTLYRFGEVTKEYNQYKNTVKGLSDKVKADTGKGVEEFKSEKIKLEASIKSIRESLSKYNFIDSHKDLEKQLTELISKINQKSLEYHEVNHKLKKIRESFQQNQAVDTKQIEKIYNEVSTHFGSLIKKSLDQITKFKEDLLENRNSFLLKKEKEFEQSIDSVFKELSKLETERSTIFAKLKEKGALDKIETTYERLVQEQTTLERNSQILQQIEEINQILSDHDVTLSELKRDIGNEIILHVNQLDQLRVLFIEILTHAIFLEESEQSGYFDIATATSSKKTSLPFKIEVKIPKADALGQERLKIIAYDLMIFLSSVTNSREIPAFLIHDGVYHGIAHTTRVNVLNYLFHKHLKLYEIKNFQYIATFNEDEIEIPEGKEETYGKFDFEWKKMVRIQLEDTPEKMLFKRDFK